MGAKASTLFGIFIFIILITSLTSCSSQQGNEEFTLKIQQFEHPHQTGVEVYHDFDSDGNYEKTPLTNVGQNTFALKTNVKPGQHAFIILMNISGKLDVVPLPWGIRAKSVQFLGKELTQEYIVKDEISNTYFAHFSVDVKKDKTIQPGAGQTFNIDKRIQSEIVSPSARVRYILPDPEYTEGLVWLQALHERDNEINSLVEIDYIEFIAVNSNGKETVLKRNDYNTNSEFRGGLFERYPFFYSDDNAPMPYGIKKGILSFDTKVYKDKVYHWWQDERSQLPKGTSHVKAKARAKITGPASVQIGIDFWKEGKGPSATEQNNQEIAASDWYFEESDWQIIEVSTERIIDPFEKWK